MRKSITRKRTQGSDSSVLFDGPSEPEPVLAAHPDEPTMPRSDTQVPNTQVEVINPQHYRLMGEFDHRPGEDAWAYLDRVAILLLKELVALATAPPSIINPKVKLEALKELIQRPMPARQVYDIRTPAAGSEFDRMSDAQVMDFVTKQIGEMRKEEIASAESTPSSAAPDAQPEED